jgi:arylsulfatase A-like enzyme
MPRPNVVLVLADDLGYSDIGCYGGEIRTPHIDGLAASGVRLARFYNTARCSPSRASLLTGLHPHQTGIGILTNDDRPVGYEGGLNDRCLTLAEVLRGQGYATCLSGKWHLTNDVRTPNDAWPTRRGFDRFFGTLTGCGSFYDPGTLTRGEENAEAEAREPGFFYTDAITDEACTFIREHTQSAPEQPFFLYTAYTAPHWPLHAREETISSYDGVFDDGWDVLRERRVQRQVEMGIVPDADVLTERDAGEPAWEDEPHKQWQARRMQAYAAMVEEMDRGIGQILGELDRAGVRDNTIVIFMSDNGASPEGLPIVELERFKLRTDILRTHTRDGRDVFIGNEPSVMPGPEDTFCSYGPAWANLSNTPFRLYKKWVHEGGIAAPFLVSWPQGQLADGSIVSEAFQLTDVLPSLLEATDLAHPATADGGGDERAGIQAPEGRSMLTAWRGDHVEERPLFWEHCGNAAIRAGGWKLVREWPGPWELYALESDPTERHDLAVRHPDVVEHLAAQWQEWADRVGVVPYEATIDMYRQMGLDDQAAEHCAAGEDAPPQKPVTVPPGGMG